MTADGVAPVNGRMAALGGHCDCLWGMGGRIYYCTDRFHSMLNIEADLHVQCTHPTIMVSTTKVQAHH